MNGSILISLIARYNRMAYTHNYVYGFIKNGLVYMMYGYGLTFGIKLDKASTKNGGGYSIRFSPTEAEKQAAINSGECEVICTEAAFLEMVKNSKYNKGEIFEKLITEKFGLVWEKDNVPFFKGADIETEEKAYSVKFQKATICTETTLNKIGA